MSSFVGFSRIDITPPLGIELTGYPNPRYASGVLDPLYINTVAFKTGENIAILSVCDTLGVAGPLSYEWPKMIAEKNGLKENSVFICHTHTHTAPLVNHYVMKADEKYAAFFTESLLKSAGNAINDLKEVKGVFANEGDIEKLTFVRRHKMKDGSYITWGDGLADKIECMEVMPDDSARLIKIERIGGEDILLLNFQCHPDNIGGDKISADFPGVFAKIMESEKPNTKCIFLNGAEGNLTRNDYKHGTTPKGYDKALLFGEKLSKGALKIYDGLTEVKGEFNITFGKSYARLKTKRDDSLVPRMKEIRKLYAEGKWQEFADKRSDAIAIAVEANQILSLAKTKQDYIDLGISFLSFGQIAFIGIPGEPFCETGQEIRKLSPYEVTCVCCHANGSEGYYPSNLAYDHGGYEPRAGKFKKGAETEIIKATKELFGK